MELEAVSRKYKVINLYRKFGLKKYKTRENGFKLKDGSCYNE